MNLIRKGHRQSHRGVIGVESAIVMIAFVIVAAALAFVVLNMGFSTTQKAKTTIVSSLSEASSALEVSGKVIGSGSNSELEVVGIPIKVATGGESVNLSNSTAAVKYLSNSVTYDNIYSGTLTDTADGDGDNGSGEWLSMAAAVDDAASLASGYLIGSVDPYDGASSPAATDSFIYWTQNSNNNDILDQGEHAVLAIVFSDADEPTALDKIRAEIIVPTGSALTVERNVPSITTDVVDLG